jgi:hypothetical protein
MRLFQFLPAALVAALVTASVAGCTSHEAPPVMGRVRVRPPGMTWRLTSTRGFSRPGRPAAADAGVASAVAARPPAGGINAGGGYRQ